jgi:hypothetical protein
LASFSLRHFRIRPSPGSASAQNFSTSALQGPLCSLANNGNVKINEQKNMNFINPPKIGIYNDDSYFFFRQLINFQKKLWV